MTITMAMTMSQARIRHRSLSITSSCLFFSGSTMLAAVRTCWLLAVVALGTFPSLALSYIPERFAEDISAAASNAALAAGDECNGKTEESVSEGDSGCALSALQHHGQKLTWVTSDVEKAQSLLSEAEVEAENGTEVEAKNSTEVEAENSTHAQGVPGQLWSSGKYPNFTLRLAEEFEAPIDLDTHPIWTWSDGGLSEGSVRFVKEAITFKGGKMRIQVSENNGAHVQTCSHAEHGPVSSKPLISGELRTRHNWFRYGRYETRMKAPEVQAGNPSIDGNFVASMFVFRDGKFKHWREIDVEVIGSGDVVTNVLNADGTSSWSPDIQVTGQRHLGSSTRSTFHTYAFEWLPDRITWYLDGKVVREHKASQGVRVPDLSGKIIVNLWVFGPSAGFGGKDIKNNKYPMHSEYEYFRFYSWDGDKQYPCKGMGTSCLSPDDNYVTGNNPCDGIQQVGLVNGVKPCRATCKH